MSELGASSNVDLDQIVSDLMQAYRHCHKGAVHCLEAGNDLATLERLKALDDCAEVNLTLANFLLRGSEHAHALAQVSASVTQACADAIAPIEHAHAQLRATYAACSRARHACLQLLGEEEAGYDAVDEQVDESFPASDPPPPPTEL